MRIYGPDDVGALRERLLKADRITGYNIHLFDLPLIWEYSRGDWTGRVNLSSGLANIRYVLKSKTDDLLRRIWQALGLDADNFGEAHKGWGLDVVAGATLGLGKIGHGAEAPKWYKAGQVQRVANYCADDVALERDLSDFIDRYGYVLGKAGVEPRAEYPKKVMVPTWKGSV